MNNIYIISYKRPEIVRTYDYLGTGHIIVPKSQEKDYRKKYGDAVLSIPDKQDGSECRKRNAVIDLIKEREPNGIGWMIDDDLLYLKRKKEREVLSGDQALEVMEILQIMMEDSNITFSGFDYTEDNMKNKDFAPFSLTKFFCQMVLLNVNDGLRYDERMRVNGDLDFWVQKMQRNRRILKMNQFAAICYGEEGGEGSVIGWDESDRTKAHKFINKKFGFPITTWNKTRWEYKTPIKGI
tara:strand:+ start:27114 stop:27830 length:717 start_codon:yes stop_codon:yes gene_type:complete